MRTFLKIQITKKYTFQIFSYLHRIFIDYSEEYTYSKFGVLKNLQIKSLFYNKGG